MSDRCVCSHLWTDHMTWCYSSGCTCRFTASAAHTLDLDSPDGSLVDMARRYVVEVFGADVLDALIEQHRPKGGPG